MECIEDLNLIKTRKYALENGDYYKGTYNDRGLRHGAGHYLFKNGAQYIGTYRRGLKHGSGKLIYPDRTIYEGDWLSNVAHGDGKYTYRSGDYYDGQWSMGKRHGLGKYYVAATQCLFHGIWQNGQRDGPGVLEFGKYKYHGIWSGARTLGRSAFTVYEELMCYGYFDYDHEPPKWITIESSAYDASRMPIQPVDYANNVGVPHPDNVDVLRTISEVDNVTDFLVDNTLHRKVMADVTEAIVEQSFTKKEIKDIAEFVLNSAAQ